MCGCKDLVVNYKYFGRENNVWEIYFVLIFDILYGEIYVFVFNGFYVKIYNKFIVC